MSFEIEHIKVRAIHDGYPMFIQHFQFIFLHLQSMKLNWLFFGSHLNHYSSLSCSKDQDGFSLLRLKIRIDLVYIFDGGVKRFKSEHDEINFLH